MEGFIRCCLALVVGGPALVVVAYFIARAVSFAYFQTKYEHMRRMLSLGEGEVDG